MENISKDLKEFTKDKPTLQNFLNFLIKNKVYEPQLYLVDTKDFDKNNVLLKASIHFLNAQLETLVPLLGAEVFAYENKNKLTFSQRFLQERFKEPSSLAALESIFKKNKSSFTIQNEEFNPFYLLESLHAQYKTPKSAHTQKIEEIIWDIAASFPQKVGESRFFKDFVVRQGLEPFKNIDYSKNPEKLVDLFIQFHANKDIIYSQTDAQSWKPINPQWAQNPKYIQDAQTLEKLLADNLSKLPKSIASVKTNLVAALIYIGADREKLITAFIDFIDKHPALIPSFAMDKLDKKDTLLHKAVYAQRGYFKNGVENHDSYETKFFDFILTHCHHLNTKNEQGIDPFELAVNLKLTATAELIHAFIEKKIMTSTLKDSLERPSEDKIEAPRKKISKI